MKEAEGGTKVIELIEICRAMIVVCAVNNCFVVQCKVVFQPFGML